MALIDIVHVREEDRESPEIAGSIGSPAPGSQAESSALDVEGWVFGRSTPAVAIELGDGRRVFHRAPLGDPRPGIAAEHPDVPDAGKSGFRTTISVLAQPHLELAVQVVLRDQRRIPFVVIETRSDGRASAMPLGEELVSVVIPCYNHAHYLDEAIRSVLAQTHPRLEVVVVDDGSSDNTSEVVARYPGVEYTYQENAGLAAARNTGIRRSTGDYVVFLDADDRLLPHAVEANLRCFSENPESGFVFGTSTTIASDGASLPWTTKPRDDEDRYRALLEPEYIGMHATVMYQRSVLKRLGGFDTSFKACEDYDMFLRIAREFPISSHQEPVAEYRMHGSNMSGASDLMLRSVHAALRPQKPYVRKNKQYREAYRAGRRAWGKLYGEQLVAQIRTGISRHRWKESARGIGVLLRHYPRGILSLAAVRHRFAGSLFGRSPRSEMEEWPPRKRRPYHVRFGSLRRTTPISDIFGFDRGRPIDRHYIESFLGRCAADVHGHVLEFGDDEYTRRFGGSRVARSDVLAVEDTNPDANIIGDLANADHIPSNTYDCIICTQTLQLVYDVRAGIRTLHRVLKPNGVLLATVPGITPIRPEEGWDWYWSFTPLVVKRLLEEVFPAENMVVQGRGNVLSAVAFLEGLAVEELRPAELEHTDPAYPVTVEIRAVKER
ncbi:MAG TPA: glycosyltransferase [Solirubrobacterales bacterium]|nr:glycosyltransferase [Solirubrobacterales bacterium]